MAVVSTLIANLGLLSFVAILIFLLVAQVGGPVGDRPRSLSIGLLLGAMSAMVVAFPIPGPMGATFDSRAAPVVLAGVLGGPAGGLVAALMGAATRLSIGGPTAVGGAVSFFLYAATGMGFAWAMRRRGIDPLAFKPLLGLSLLATLLVLPSFFVAQPVATGVTILERFWHILLLVNVVGLLMLGLLLGQMLAVAKARDRHRLDQETSELARSAGGIGIWRFDRRTGRQVMDAIACRVMGLPSDGPMDEDVSVFRQLILPEDRARVDREMLDGRTRGGVRDIRFRIRTPSGDLRHIRTSTIDVGGRPEAPDLTIGAGIDESADVKLREEMTLRGAALDFAADGIIIADAGNDLPLVYANRRFLEMTGYSANEVLGRNCRFLNEGLPAQPAMAELRQAIKRGENCSVTLQNIRRDGSLFWNSLAVSAIRDDTGEVRHFIGVLSDITAQIDARLEAENARDELQAVLLSAPDAILTVDEALTVTSFNPAAERLFGWNQAEILGQPVDRLIPEEIRPHHGALAMGYVGDKNARPGSMAMRIIKARRRDGSTFPAQISLGRFVQAGRPVVAVTAQDMTDIVEANDKLTGLSLELADQLKMAEEASEAKSQFLAHMSHELRTPLNAVLGFADLIRWTGPEAIGPEKLSGYIDDIHRSGSQLLDLINDVLDLSKIESDALPITLEPCDPRALVEAAVETVRPIAEARKVALRLSVSTTEPTVCDRRAMHQSLLNLLSNAVKFSPVGRPVDIQVSALPGQIRYAVRDRGAGMPPEMVEQIGQPFLRGTVSHLSSNSGGTGLGLAITKRLLERQNGRLEVESMPGTGSTFTIVFEPATNTGSEDTGSEDTLRATG